MNLQSVLVSQSPEDKFREYLTTGNKSQRFTGQQRDMVRFIFSHHDHFDAEALISDMQAASLKISRATAYRTLNKLVDAGLLRKLELGPRTFYEHDYGYPQHDHLQCTKCSKVIEFQNSSIEEAIKQASLANGFQSEGHSFIVRGVCKECNIARMPKRQLDLI